MIIYNGIVVNQGECFRGYVEVVGDRIARVGRGDAPDVAGERVDACGGYIMAGLIDDQVHFRDPGLTYKGDIETESRAAVAGGVTSFMDMPNTIPQTTTREMLEKKHEHAAEVSAANYSFFFGGTNDNLKEIASVDPKIVPGIKVFMGSSTGGMLVDRRASLEAIFAESPVLVATHCEDEGMIQANIRAYGDKATIFDHPSIRSAQACYRSSSLAAEIATKYDARLHILHLSTELEMSIFDVKPLAQKRITGEVCVHHLWFSDADYATKGNFIKWNPAIKTIRDRDALRRALIEGRVDIVATDHAPHTLEEKERPYTLAPSGGPLVQHSLIALLDMFSPEKVSEFGSHRVADCFGIDKRGYLREGYYADIVIVKKTPYTVTKDNILYKCGWSPFEGTTFGHTISRTFVGGQCVYNNGVVDTSIKGRALTYNR